MAHSHSKQKQVSSKGSKILFIIGAVVIIALIAIIIFLVVNTKETEEPKRNVVVNHSNAESIAAEMINQEYIQPGYYSVSMSTEWHFDRGDSISGDAYVANREENTNDIYFDVFLAEDETEPILKSPVIPRGSEMENISLDKALDAGTYDCVMVYHLIDEDQNTVSTLRVGFVIIVEK